MECPECGQPLHIAGSKLESDVGSTDVYSVKTMVCVNQNCGSWCGVRAGGKLSEAVKIAAIVKNKEN
jgi:hypothetical protein